MIWNLQWNYTGVRYVDMQIYTQYVALQHLQAYNILLIISFYLLQFFNDYKQSKPWYNKFVVYLTVLISIYPQFSLTNRKSPNWQNPYKELTFNRWLKFSCFFVFLDLSTYHTYLLCIGDIKRAIWHIICYNGPPFT